MVFSRLSTISCVTGAKCSLNRSYFSGSVANSAAIVNNSRCRFLSMSFTLELSDSDRANPMAETASSVIPYASVLGLFLETLPPYRRLVSPLSPNFV